MSLLKIIHAVRGSGGLEACESAFFAQHIAKTSRLDAESGRGYLEKLLAVGPADEDLPRAEAITILAVSQKGAAEAIGLDPVECASQTASALQEAEHGERALGLLEACWAVCDRAPALLREIETLRVKQRRAERMLHDMLARAENALRSGDKETAAAVLEEARVLNPNGTPVRRIEASIQRLEDEAKRKRVQRVGFLVAVSALVGLGWFAFDWERNARQAYEALPVVQIDELESVSERLGRLESFVARYPIWTGTLDALEERGKLRAQERSLLNLQVVDAQVVKDNEEARWQEAEFAWREGKRLFEIGQFESALREMDRALELGPDDWDRADRVARDRQAIEEFLLQEVPR